MLKENGNNEEDVFLGFIQNYKPYTVLIIPSIY